MRVAVLFFQQWISGFRRRNQPKIFKKSACEIFHDEATLKFSNPQLVWLIEQSVSLEVIFIVKPFSKSFLVCAFIATIFVANLNAQPSSQVKVGDLPTVSNSIRPTTLTPADEPAEEKVPQAAPILFWIGPLPVTNSMICTWIVALFILVIVRFSTWKIKEIPSGMQNALEALVESLESLMGDILDKRVSRWVFPFAATFLIFIVMSNFVDLIPGVGSIGFYSPDKSSFTPLFRPPTTDANLTMAMAGIFLMMSLFWAVRYNGVWGLIKHVFGVKMETNKWAYPLFFVLFIFIGIMEALSILIVRPVALGMRLYGNIFGGENVLDTMLHHKSIFVSVLTALPFYFYEVFVCLLQAFVFALLVVAFVGTLCTQDEEHGH
jgi:F-type H+-transporting ATPase subunit a